MSLMSFVSGRRRLLSCLLALSSVLSGATVAQGRETAEPSSQDAPAASNAPGTNAPGTNAPGTNAPASNAPADSADESSAEPETVIARRLNDSVAVRFAADGQERLLYFFDPRAELSVGDEIEQGPSGQTTVNLSDGGLLVMYASGHLIIGGLGTMRAGEVVDLLRFQLLTTAEVTSRDRKIVCELPGGIEVEFLDGRITLTVVPGRLTIRNEGGNPVMVRGLMTQEAASTVVSGEGTLLLGRGDEVAMPYFKQRSRRLGAADGTWAGLSLRDLGSLELEQDAQRLVVTSSSTAKGREAFTVGGVRTQLPGGMSFVFERQRRGAPSVMHRAGQQAVLQPELLPESQELTAPMAEAAAPVGMSAIDLEFFTIAREKGHSVEDLAALGFWVAPSVLAEYEKMMAQADSGEDAPAAEEMGGDLSEDPPSEPLDETLSEAGENGDADETF
ncbi:MAG: hypothetical protein ACI9EF_000030 [Pseudohongiellaceae bacterium]|jgi:hypothetical protein